MSKSLSCYNNSQIKVEMNQTQKKIEEIKKIYMYSFFRMLLSFSMSFSTSASWRAFFSFAWYPAFLVIFSRYALFTVVPLRDVILLSCFLAIIKISTFTHFVCSWEIFHLISFYDNFAKIDFQSKVGISSSGASMMSNDAKLFYLFSCSKQYKCFCSFIKKSCMSEANDMIFTKHQSVHFLLSWSLAFLLWRLLTHMF